MSLRTQIQLKELFNKIDLLYKKIEKTDSIITKLTKSEALLKEVTNELDLQIQNISNNSMPSSVRQSSKKSSTKLKAPS